MSIGRTRAEARRYALPGFIGDFATSSDHNRTKTLWNKSPQTAQVATITVDTGTNSYAYTFTVNGQTITYTADASTTTTEVANGLKAAFDADPIGSGVATASTNGSNALILTANVAGVGFTIAAVDSKMTLVATTANDEADAVPFGRVMISGGYSTQGPEKYGSIFKSASFTAQVDTFSPTYVSGAVVALKVLYREKTWEVSVVSDTSAQDMVEELVAAFNSLMPANTIVATEDNTTITLTAEILGEEFLTSVGSSDEGASIPVFTTTSNRSRSTSLALAFAGISLRSGVDPASTSEGTEGEYAANAGVLSAYEGEVWVASSQTISEGEYVYVEGTTAADLGKCFNTSSSTRVLLPPALARWARDCRVSGDARAVVRVNVMA